MSDRLTKYAEAISKVERRRALLADVDLPNAYARAVMRVADAELAALEQECRDRECTEQDVRARLADAENALALVRGLHYRRPWCAMQDSSTFGQSVFHDQCDHCRTAWPCNTSAVLDGTP